MYVRQCARGNGAAGRSRAFLAVYGYPEGAPSAFFKTVPRPICRFSDFFLKKNQQLLHLLFDREYICAWKKPIEKEERVRRESIRPVSLGT